jgi:hypothetical protein
MDKYYFIWQLDSVFNQAILHDSRQCSTSSYSKLPWVRKHIQGDQRVSVHLMITIQKATSNVHYHNTCFLPHCLAAYCQGHGDPRLTLTPSVIPNSMLLWQLVETASNIFACFLYCNHHVHRNFLITLYLVYYFGQLHQRGQKGRSLQKLTNSTWQRVSPYFILWRRSSDRFI